MRDVIRIHVDAPPKPAVAAPCNGCGVCCASAPCPLGAVFSGRTQGACAALQWVDASARYRCGLVAAPRAHLPAALGAFAPALARFARRSIDAGSGCDCSLEVVRPAPGSED